MNQRIPASRKGIPKRWFASRHLPGPAVSPGVRGSAPVLSPMSALPLRSARLRRSPGSARAGGVKGGPQAERQRPLTASAMISDPTDGGCAPLATRQSARRCDLQFRETTSKRHLASKPLITSIPGKIEPRTHTNIFKANGFGSIDNFRPLLRGHYSASSLSGRRRRT